MKERPIIFNGEMVRAILAGRKTQTRRVIKPQPPAHCTKVCTCSLNAEWADKHLYPEPVFCIKCSYGIIGGRLYVREAFSPWADDETRNCIQGARDVPCLYRADYADDCPSTEVGGDYHWKPSIRMPKKFSRIMLEITDVRVQRIQEISEEDAKAEGIEPYPAEGIEPYPIAALNSRGEYYPEGDSNQHYCAFADLWNSINAKRGYGWDVNPWVWIIGFKCVNMRMGGPYYAYKST